MEFLLILSAMLSAVTGAFTGTRGDEGRIHQQQAAVAAEAEAVAVEVQAPRLAALPTEQVASPEAVQPTPFALVAAAPLEAVRLIE